MNKAIYVSVLAVVLTITGFSLFGRSQPETFGNSDVISKRVDVYGTISATTIATTTSEIIALGPDYKSVSLNIKASSSAAQNITVYPEFSNENNCDTATTWFRETNNTVSGATVTVSTSTYSLAIDSGLSYNSVVIDDLRTRCVKLTFNTSSTTVPAITWVEGYFSN
jgi:hypothetical protein